MKSGIHPKYQQIQVACACGNSFTTGSTSEKISTEVCSACHPFYTGVQKLVDTAGRVERFAQRASQSDQKALAQKKEKETARKTKKVVSKPKAEANA